MGEDEALKRLPKTHTLCSVPPFSYLDRDFYAKGIEDAFTPKGIEDFRAYALALMTGGLNADTMAQHRRGILQGRLTPVLAHGIYLARYASRGSVAGF